MEAGGDREVGNSCGCRCSSPAFLWGQGRWRSWCWYTPRVHMCRERKDETWQSRWCLHRSGSSLVRVVWLGLYVGENDKSGMLCAGLGRPPGMDLEGWADASGRWQLGRSLWRAECWHRTFWGDQSCCLWVWWNSLSYCRMMVLDPEGARAAPAADAEESSRSRGGNRELVSWLCLLSSFGSLVAFPYIKFLI